MKFQSYLEVRLPDFGAPYQNHMSRCLGWELNPFKTVKNRHQILIYLH